MGENDPNGDKMLKRKHGYVFGCLSKETEFGFSKLSSEFQLDKLVLNSHVYLEFDMQHGD